jgi:hypothetical protein
MRIWSLHPKYLDTKGIVALWREALLAKHVLEGKTKGYTMHPQLDRFRRSNMPLNAINYYLSVVYKSAIERGYNFDKNKINWDFDVEKISVTSGQLAYEARHLLKKLEIRDPKKYEELKDLRIFDAHPVFDIIGGEIESWEKLQ